MVTPKRDTNIPTTRSAGGVVSIWSLAMGHAAIEVKLDNLEAMMQECLTLIRDRRAARQEPEPSSAQAFQAAS